MDCWHCRRTAVGVCRFCGRGMCEDHAKMQPFILELFKTTERDPLADRRGRLVLRRLQATPGARRPPRARHVTHVTPRCVTQVT